MKHLILGIVVLAVISLSLGQFLISAAGVLGLLAIIAIGVTK